jgi:hypothetical protein
VLKRLLLLSFLLGCAVSVLASGRFTPRLIADGMLSFAFVPACELAGFAASRQLFGARGRFGDDGDRFLRGNWPWLTWMLVISAFAAVSSPDAGFNGFNAVILGAVFPIVASIWIDYRFFRMAEDNRRGRARAIGAIVVQRAVAWPLAAFYFLGFAVPPREILHTFVEIKDTLAHSITVLLS